MNKRASGVLMHISSLPGDYSVGSFGKEAFEFVGKDEFLVDYVRVFERENWFYIWGDGYG